MYILTKRKNTITKFHGRSHGFPTSDVLCNKGAFKRELPSGVIYARLSAVSTYVYLVPQRFSSVTPPALADNFIRHIQRGI